MILVDDLLNFFGGNGMREEKITTDHFLETEKFTGFLFLCAVLIMR